MISAQYKVFQRLKQFLVIRCAQGRPVGSQYEGKKLFVMILKMILIMGTWKEEASRIPIFNSTTPKKSGKDW
jgi:hypothetical protein